MLGKMLEDDIAELIKARDFEALKIALDELPAPDVAEILIDLPDADEAVLFRLMPRKQAAEAFSYLPPADQEALLNQLGRDTLAGILNDMTPDDRTRLLEELPGEVTAKLLTMLTPEELKVARRLLGYPEGSVGRLMTPEYVAIRPEWTVREVIEHLRKIGAGEKETLAILYVVDDHNKLLDDIRLSAFVLADPDKRVSDISDGQFTALRASDDRETAVAAFRKYGRLALPVTDSDGVLVGIVTIDDVLQVAEEEADEDFGKFAGHGAIDEPYFATGFWSMLRKRGTWLVMLFLGEMLTSNALKVYEESFELIPALVLFIPLIISSGGNSGGQSASLILRGLSTREVMPGDWLRIAFRELYTGAALGVLLALVGFARVWLNPPVADNPALLANIALTISGALVGVVTVGSMVGAILPIFFKKLGADPAVTSSPFIATLVDVTGIVIYFSVAHIFLAAAFEHAAALKAAAGG